MGGTQCQSTLPLGWEEVFGYGTITHCLPCAASEKYGAVSTYSYASGGWTPPLGGCGRSPPPLGRKKTGGPRPAGAPDPPTRPAPPPPYRDTPPHTQG